MHQSLANIRVEMSLTAIIKAKFSFQIQDLLKRMYYISDRESLKPESKSLAIYGSLGYQEPISLEANKRETLIQVHSRSL